MSPPLVARAELMSIDTSASVWSMTMLPPDGRSTVCVNADSIWRFDLEAREQRHRVVVMLELLQVLRHDLLDELAASL